MFQACSKHNAGQGYDIVPIVTPKRRKAGQSPPNQSMHLPSTKPFASLGTKDGVTAYRGVTFEKTRKLWRSQAYVNGKVNVPAMDAKQLTAMSRHAQ